MKSQALLQKQTSQHWGAQGLGLDEDDHKWIMTNQWLFDEHIKSCSTLLKKAHPFQSGLHDTITLAKKPLQCISPTEFVQIVHVNQSHWVCLSNINCPPGVVDVYDSIPNYSANSKVLHKQAAAISQCMEKQLEIHFVDVQAQEAGNDCGLFAIAFATALYDGIDPHGLSLDQDGMRQHLAVCS